MRPKHYIKNFLIFVCLAFDGNLFYLPVALKAFGGFWAFSLLSSAIYIINDIRDREADRLHEVKKSRPIASGTVSVYEGVILAAILMAMAVLLNNICSELWQRSLLIMGIYFCINLGYGKRCGFSKRYFLVLVACRHLTCTKTECRKMFLSLIAPLTTIRLNRGKRSNRLPYIFAQGQER